MHIKLQRQRVTEVQTISYCFILIFSSILDKVRTHPLSRLQAMDDDKIQQKTEAIQRLSQVFGIDPTPRHPNHRSPPQYMTELYNAIAGRDGLTRTTSPFNADVVRSFPDRDTQHHMHFYFNVSYINSEETILQAEFHLFKMRPRTVQPTRLHLLQLKIYQVLDESNMFSPGGVKLLDARRISAHTHGWEVFNVKEAVNSWIKNENENHGFLVTATSLAGEHVNGTVVRFAQRNEHHDSKQPILVVFTDEGKRKYFNRLMSPGNELSLSSKEYTFQHRRHAGRHQARYSAVAFLNERFRAEQQHEIQLNTGNPNFNETDNDDDENEHHGFRGKREAHLRQSRGRRRQKKQASTCDRHELYVDFEEIGWSDWIISPKGYHAYHCKGECPFPLGQNQKPTNHATVQSIVHALKIGKNVGTPCCVPNKLYSISLLYFDDHENVILKQYDDMVADSCGCH